MPLKLFGALLLAGAGLFGGASYAAARRRTIAQIGDLCSALDYMRARIAMLRTPVPDLFAALAQRTGPSAVLFQDAQRLLAQGLEAAMQQACSTVEDGQARQIMYSLGSVLGRYEADEELRQLDAAIVGLETRAAQLERDYQGKAPLVRRLTAAAGICLAILLL